MAFSMCVQGNACDRGVLAAEADVDICEVQITRGCR